MELSPYFYGPFWVIPRNGRLAYKSQLSEDFPIHPFQVKKLDHQATPIVNLPKMMEDRIKKEELMAILDCRLVLAQGLEQLPTGPGHPFHVEAGPSK